METLLTRMITLQQPKQKTSFKKGNTAIVVLIEMIMSKHVICPNTSSMKG